jgi:hypothetical protein
MKFFLQDCRSAKFMRCDSSWSADINEALDFLSERRAIFFGMKELEDSFRILKVKLEASLPAFIPQLILPGSSQNPIRETKHIYEQVPLKRRLQFPVRGLREMFPRLNEVLKLNLL